MQAVQHRTSGLICMLVTVNGHPVAASLIDSASKVNISHGWDNPAPHLRQQPKGYA